MKAACLAVVLLAAACGAPDGKANGTPVAWKAVSVDPVASQVTIDIAVGSSSCSELVAVDAEESSDSVVIVARVITDTDSDCTTDCVHETRTVELREPLADRALKGSRGRFC